MKRLLETALAAIPDVEYAEVRLQRRRSFRVRFSGREIEDVGPSRHLAGSVRVRAGGAWGFSAFHDPAGIAERAREAAANARRIGRAGVRLAP
ncbi:MAG: hypothetical protein CVU65_17420, partial [Deltaproteobacteria bacterium HGW-Deltaproteobacteria-22]